MHSKVICAVKEPTHEAIEKVMAPFAQEVENNSPYAKFYNLEEDFRNDTRIYIKLPSGEIIPQYDYYFHVKYVIVNDEGPVEDMYVARRNFGPARTIRRTKKSNKMIVLGEKHPCEIYKDIHAYAKANNETWHEEQKAYGYYANPNGKWDYYTIGGRYNHTFAIPESALATLPEKRSSFGELFEILVQGAITGKLEVPESHYKPKYCPEGFVITDLAKKSDVDWSARNQFRGNRIKAIYQKIIEKYASVDLESITNPFEFYRDLGLVFGRNEDGTMDKTWLADIETNEPIYKQGDTLEQFLECFEWKETDADVNIECYSFINSSGEWVVNEGATYGFPLNVEPSDEQKEASIEYNKKLKEFWDSIPDDMYVVALDCHS